MTLQSDHPTKTIPDDFGERDVELERNLLFGALAMQIEHIDAGQFASVCAEWTKDKDVPLDDLLVKRGWITPDERTDIESLLQEK